MSHTSRHAGRLFYCALALLMPLASVYAQTVTLTTISGVVFRADGTPAGGTLLISWPAFTTAGGQAVAAGNASVILGAGGTFSVQLAPNAGATPAGTVYTVVYQLDDGAVECLTASAWAEKPAPAK